MLAPCLENHEFVKREESYLLGGKYLEDQTTVFRVWKKTAANKSI